MFTRQFSYKRLWWRSLLCLLLLFPGVVHAAPTHQLWRPIVNRAEGFRLKIPPQWQALELSKAEIGLGLSMAGVENPRFQALFNNPFFQQLIADGMKFAAFDLSDQGLRYDLPANVTVAKLAVVGTISLTDLQTLNERQLAALADPNYPLYSDIVTVGNQTAVSFHYVVAQKFGFLQPQVTSVNQLLMVKEGVQYILTISVPLAALDDYVDTVATMLASFQLLSAPPTPEPTPKPTQVIAVVKVAKLNIRSGPGTNYRVIGAVSQNQRLWVTGRADNRCSWLQIPLQGSQNGWIAGPPTYSTIEGNCNALPLTTAPPPPPTPAAKPCVRFDNFFNKVVDVTLTIPGNPNWHHKFNIAPNGRQTHCLTPGRYTFSVGVPGVGNVNGEFTLERGDGLLVIPIYQEFN